VTRCFIDETSLSVDLTNVTPLSRTEKPLFRSTNLPYSRVLPLSLKFFTEKKKSDGWNGCID